MNRSKSQQKQSSLTQQDKSKRGLSTLGGGKIDSVNLSNIKRLRDTTIVSTNNGLDGEQVSDILDAFAGQSGKVIEQLGGQVDSAIKSVSAIAEAHRGQHRDGQAHRFACVSSRCFSWLNGLYER